MVNGFKEVSAGTIFAMRNGYNYRNQRVFAANNMAARVFFQCIV